MTHAEAGRGAEQGVGVARRSAEILEDLRLLRIRGGSAIGRAALTALALAAAEGPDDPSALGEHVRAVGRELLALAPVMATVARAVRDAEAIVEEELRRGAPAAGLRARLRAWAERSVRRSEADLTRLAEVGARLVGSGRTLVTHSFSDTVLRVLTHVARAGATVRVVLTESRPLCEGRRLAEAVAALGLPCELIPDAAMGVRVRGADLVMVGADAVLPSGAFLNKTGTYLLALAAAAAGVPVYVAAETAKVDPRAALGWPVPVPDRPAAEVLGEWTPPPGLAVWNRFFETTPARLVEAFITERGLLSPAAMAAAVRAEEEA